MLCLGKLGGREKANGTKGGRLFVDWDEQRGETYNAEFDLAH